MSGAVRVLVVADTHGVLDVRITALMAQADVAVHAGDIGSPCVLASMNAHAPRVVAVRGNNDTPKHWPREAHAALAALPEVDALDLPGGSLVVEHGHRAAGRGGYHVRLRARHPQARAIVYGHTHRLVRDTRHRPWVLNPGAAGRTRTYGGPSCLLVVAATNRWRVREVRFALHG